MEQNEYEGHSGDRPTKVSAEALLSKPEVKCVHIIRIQRKKQVKC